jgi:hypothetical protein
VCHPAAAAAFRPLGRLGSGCLGELGPDLLDGHPHFQRGSVRFLEFGTQPFQPLAALVEAIAFGGDEGFASLELRFSFLFRLSPGVALANEFLLAARQLSFARQPLIGLKGLLAGQ